MSEIYAFSFNFRIFFFLLILSVWHKFMPVSIAEHMLKLRNKLEDMFCNVWDITSEDDGILVNALYCS